MFRLAGPLSLLAIAAALAPLKAQPADPPESVLGARLGAVPDVVYAHLPALLRGQGALVEDVEPDSPLQRAGVRRHDILIGFGGVAVRDARHLSQLAAQAPAGETRSLALIRGGRQTAVSVDMAAAAAFAVAKALPKPGGPPAVTVEAEPLEQGKFKVVLRFYAANSGKLEEVPCSGSLGEIEAEVRSLRDQNRISPRVQDLIDVVLQRIRELNKDGTP